MGFLVRKFHRPYWESDSFQNPDVSGDAITRCLGTKRNTISVWEIQDESDIEEAVLAIASTQDYVSTMDLFLLTENDLLANNIEFESTQGDTKVSDLKNSHKDLKNIGLNHLCSLKDIIIKLINSNSTTRINSKQQKRILLSAIKSGRLNYKHLHPEMQKQLGGYLQKEIANDRVDLLKLYDDEIALLIVFLRSDTTDPMLGYSKLPDKLRDVFSEILVDEIHANRGLLDELSKSMSNNSNIYDLINSKK